MKNILLMSLIYSPDNVSTAQIMAGIAGDLNRGAFRVKVLTSTPHYHRDTSMEARQPLRWALWPFLQKSQLDGVDVLHIPMPDKSCPKMLRLLSWFWFVGMAFVAGVLMRFRPDAILVCTPPPFLGPCAALLSMIKGSRLVYNVQELYPDIAVNLGVMRAGGVIEKFFTRMEQFTYRRATWVTSITEAMCAKLRMRLEPEKVKLVPNFVELVGEGRGAVASALDRPFTVTYAGNMGIPQKLDLLVAAARVLPAVKVWFVGDGRDKARLKEQAKGLENVVFTDYQPLSEMPRIYAESDLFYVGQDPAACSDGIPSKLYRILGNGKPILAVTPDSSDMAEFVRTSGGGVVVDDFSPISLAKAVQELMSNRERCERLATQGKRYVLDHFSREKISARYATLLS